MTDPEQTTADAGRAAPGVRRADPGPEAPAARESGSAPRARRGLRRGSALAIALAIGLVVAVLDQISKHLAESTLSPVEPRPLLGSLLQARLLYNSGAAWGLGAGITPVVTIVQILICAGALWFVVRSVRSPGWTIALGLVVGGALGNIHDRLLRPPGPFRGEVVDFLELPHWPVFNVADSAVVAGALLIVLLGVIGVPTDPRPADGTEARAGADA